MDYLKNDMQSHNTINLLLLAFVSLDKNMRKIFAIIGALVTGSIAILVGIIPQVVEAGKEAPLN